MSEGLCSIFFTSREEEEQKMRRIFVTDIFLEHVHKSALAWDGFSSQSLQPYYFFLPKKFLISHTTSLFIHFQNGLTTHIVRGKGLQPLPGPTLLGHVPWLLKHAKKVIFPHHKYFSADLCYQIEIIITYLFLLKKFVLIWNRTIGFIFYSYRWIWPIFFGSP